MTLVSRRKYDHPTLATAGGTGLHASIENLYTLIGNDSMSRYAAFSAIANSTVAVNAHEFGLDFANLKVQIFTGTYPALTLVADPVGSGWTVAATSGLASRSIDVTTPASGGPHTFAVLVSHESLGTQYIPGLVGIGTQSFAGAKTFLTSTDTPISGITNYALFSEVAAPGTPVAGKVAIYAKTDKKMYRKGSDGVEAEIGSGSASGFINYILNADLEAGNTTGWATYKDAAAATPVDGTGGSPTTLTLTANGTTPLRGNFDLKIAKTAANSQGEGFSYAFTIKSPDISKKLQVSFDLNTSDANYVSGDVVVYLYDVTNSVLITPSVTAIPKVGASTYSFTFDTTTSLSYRLIFHWSTTNATASNIYFENFFVGPGSLVQGAAVSPWVSGLFTVSTTTNATTVSYFQRVGSSMNVIVKTTYSGASNAGTGHNITLPAGYTIDTTASPLLTTVGTAQFYDDDLSTYTQGIVLSVSSTIVRARWSDDTAAGVQHINSTATTPFTIAANDVWSFQFTIPIAEWAAQGTANLGINPIQYLGNSNTSTSTSDTSAFTFGPAGNSIVAVSSTGVWVKKRVQLLQGNWSASGGTPIVKVSADGLLWLNAQDVFPPLKSAGLFYGIDIQVSGVNTVDVAFGGDGASTGAAWSTVTSYKWRVDVAVPGQAVGFGIASLTASGLIPSGVYNNTTQAWILGPSTGNDALVNTIYGSIANTADPIPSFSSANFRYIGNKFNAVYIRSSSVNNSSGVSFRYGLYFDGSNNKQSTANQTSGILALLPSTASSGITFRLQTDSSIVTPADTNSTLVDIITATAAGVFAIGPTAGLGTTSTSYHTVYGSTVGIIGTTRASFTGPTEAAYGANFFRDGAGTAKAIGTGGASYIEIVGTTTPSNVAFYFETTTTSQTAGVGHTSVIQIATATAAGAWAWGASGASGASGGHHIVRTGTSGVSTSMYVNGEIHFGNSDSGGSLPTIVGTTSTAGNYGLYLAAGTPDANTNGDMVFDVSLSGSNFTTNTNKAFRWTRNGTEIVSFTRAGACTFGPPASASSPQHSFIVGASNSFTMTAAEIHIGNASSSGAQPIIAAATTDASKVGLYISAGNTNGGGGIADMVLDVRQSVGSQGSDFSASLTNVAFAFTRFNSLTLASITREGTCSLGQSNRRFTAGVNSAASTGGVALFGNASPQGMTIAANTTATFVVSVSSASAGAMIIVYRAGGQSAIFLVNGSNISNVVFQNGAEFANTTAGNNSSLTSITFANAGSTCTIKNGFATSNDYFINVIGCII